MDISQIIHFAITYLLPTGLFGVVLAYYFNRRLEKYRAELSKELERARGFESYMSARMGTAYVFKQERYAAMLTLLHDAYIAEELSAEKKEAFLSEFYKAWIYASDDVIKAINEFHDLFLHSDTISAEDAQSKVGRIAIAMREDLGQASTLREKDFVYRFVIRE